jgi:hypothetical protein
MKMYFVELLEQCLLTYHHRRHCRHCRRRRRRRRRHHHHFSLNTKDAWMRRHFLKNFRSFLLQIFFLFRGYIGCFPVTSFLAVFILFSHLSPILYVFPF